jgi:hypothetical protein
MKAYSRLFLKEIKRKVAKAQRRKDGKWDPLNPHR